MSVIKPSIPNMENSGLQPSLAKLALACITETGCLSHTESWYIHLSVCSVKGQVYTLQAQRKGSLCLSFSLSNPTSLILDSRVQTHIVSPNMSVARQTHTYCILYERTKSSQMHFLPQKVFPVCDACRSQKYLQYWMLLICYLRLSPLASRAQLLPL